MSIKCHVVVDRAASSEELATLGSAMWRWCNRTRTGGGIYQYLDSQVLADLIAGQLPSSGQTPEQSVQKADGIHVEVYDDESNDRQAAVDGLRQGLPTQAIVDIIVLGQSWNQQDGTAQPAEVA